MFSQGTVEWRANVACKCPSHGFRITFGRQILQRSFRNYAKKILCPVHTKSAVLQEKRVFFNRLEATVLHYPRSALAAAMYGIVCLNPG